MAGILYTTDDHFRAFKILIATELSGQKVKLASDFVFGVTNKTDEFRRKFPTGKIPAYETHDGKYLSESNAIAYYLANEELRGGRDTFHQAQVQQWINFADSEILPAACAWLFPCLSIMAYKKPDIERAKELTYLNLKILDDKLLHNTYLVGERITLADITVFCNLLNLYQYVLEVSTRQLYRNLARWFNTLLNQPAVKKVIGEIKLCIKAEQFDGKKFSEFQKKSTEVGESKKTDNVEKVNKEKKDKNKDKPKEKQQKKDVEKEELDQTDEVLAAEPKSKDPFEALPKGTFVMDDFKKFYSNHDEKESIPYFWEKFDHDNYSIWFGEYKYNDELKMAFMSCNLITGMFQRLDKMRKNSFASVCLFGEDNNSSISGIWIWRGKQLAFELSEDLKVDYDCYNWSQLDSKSDDTKKLVDQYLSWTGFDKEGRKFNQGKIFK